MDLLVAAVVLEYGLVVGVLDSQRASGCVVVVFSHPGNAIGLVGAYGVIGVTHLVALGVRGCAEQMIAGVAEGGRAGQSGLNGYQVAAAVSESLRGQLRGAGTQERDLTEIPVCIVRENVGPANTVPDSVELHPVIAHTDIAGCSLVVADLYQITAIGKVALVAALVCQAVFGFPAAGGGEDQAGDQLILIGPGGFVF